MNSALEEYNLINTCNIENFSANDNIVTCDIMGGLGNQLFIICTTIAYAIQHNKKNNFYFYYKKSYGNRPSYWDTIFFRLSSHLIYSEIIIDENNIFIEPDLSYHIIPDNIVKLHGYFQSEKYFKNQMDGILKILDITSFQNTIRNKMIVDKNVIYISIHFRLGDYKAGNSIYVIQSNEYYERCISYLVNKINTSFTLLCFYEKNDSSTVTIMIDKLVKKYPFISIIHVPNYNLEDWEELVLMSCCNHNIIANSSFSWWGAYLNPFVTKLVCYPSAYYKNDFSTKDLYPSEWIKIDS